MHLEFLVEERSAEAALIHILAKILPPDCRYDIRVFQGKQDLLEKLPVRLRAYASTMTPDDRLIILVDEDRQDCHALKARLEQAAHYAGLITRSQVLPGMPCQVLNRIAIEELEAWFFGDVLALRQAYPRLPEGLARKAGSRNPDAISGGTWEALQRTLQKAGYFPGGLAKIEVARQVAAYMDPDRNTSRSFQVFRDSLRAMVAS
jgi:hypothetical protein